MSKITEIAEKCAEPITKSLGIAIWDAEYLKEGGRMVLRVNIDRPDGAISTDDCEAVSRALEAELDRIDPIPGEYTLEVSSAGLERTLKRAEHFAASIGREVEIGFYKPQGGRKKVRAVLEARDAENTSAGGEIFQNRDISSVKWVFNWETI